MGEDKGLEDKDTEGGSGNKRLVVIVVSSILLVLGGGAGAYFTGLADPLLTAVGLVEVEANQDSIEGPSAEARQPAPIGSAVFYDLPDMLANLSTPGNRTSFLQITLSLELQSEEDVAIIESVLPRIIDSLQVYLRELRLEDLEGSQGMFRVRNEMRNRVNEAIQPTEIDDVLFREIVIQ
ncbi:MAG: flagellar basal body-associated FliL family protein [Rhodospirillaceae bacterium]